MQFQNYSAKAAPSVRIRGLIDDRRVGLAKQDFAGGEGQAITTVGWKGSGSMVNLVIERDE